MRLSTLSHPGSLRSAGMTLVEVVIALTVVAVSASIFYRLVLATTDLRSLNRENAIAADAARVVLEDLRAEAFHELFALYNADPADDPGGNGTAPGATFLVDGLDLPAGGVAHGTVVLPSLVVEVEEEIDGQVVVVEDWQLREDLDLPDLGLPRDLNGDSMVDGRDHSPDYQLLPVVIRIQWESRHGTRTFEMASMFCLFR